ncbi:MAG: helix-hairpin-helix domain-containing protein [Erysipelotrichaceae bacterium]
MKKLFGICVILLLLVAYLDMNEVSLLPASKPLLVRDVLVEGEVMQPGVYEVHQNTTLEELILMAGGITDLARSDYNPKQKVFTSDYINIPAIKVLEPISINFASVEELQAIPGIGPAMAQKIIDYRESVGLFQTLEDVMNIKGIKEKLFEKMKDYICL